MAGIADLLNKKEIREGDLDALVAQIMQEANPQDVDYLRALVMDVEEAKPRAEANGDITVPAVPISNADLNRYIQADERFRHTNVGQNPASYIHPAYITHFTQMDIPSEKEGHVIHGEYQPGSKPRWLWANANMPAENVANTAVHENIHANTHERKNYYPDAAKRPERILENKALGQLLGRSGSDLNSAYRKLTSHSPYLHDEITAAVKSKMPIPYDIEYGPTEPAAWAGATESLLPAGQMPIQEEMNRQGLGALYGEMTSTGPVATRWDPSFIDSVKEHLFNTSVPVAKRIRNYIEGAAIPEEPYELKGNSKKGKKNGGSVAAIVAHNQKLRARRRR